MKEEIFNTKTISVPFQHFVIRQPSWTLSIIPHHVFFFYIFYVSAIIFIHTDLRTDICNYIVASLPKTRMTNAEQILIKRRIFIKTIWTIFKIHVFFIMFLINRQTFSRFVSHEIKFFVHFFMKLGLALF